jgi:hypothetical protein
MTSTSGRISGRQGRGRFGGGDEIHAMRRCRSMMFGSMERSYSDSGREFARRHSSKPIANPALGQRRAGASRQVRRSDSRDCTHASRLAGLSRKTASTWRHSYTRTRADGRGCSEGAMNALTSACCTLPRSYIRGIRSSGVQTAKLTLDDPRAI